MARKINVKLILELREAKLSRNTIADSRHIARNSVSDVFRIAEERGITYRDVRSLSEVEVYSMFYPDRHAVENIYSLPDYEHVHNELKKVGVTLYLLWEEYQSNCRSEGTLPVGKTKFYEGYQDFVISRNLTNQAKRLKWIGQEKPCPTSLGIPERSFRLICLWPHFLTASILTWKHVRT